MILVVALVLSEIALLYVFLALLSTFSVWIVSKINRKLGILGIDINKPSKPKVPESCGIALILPLIFAVAYMHNYLGDFRVVSWFLLVLGFALIGFVDDIKHKISKEKFISWHVRAILIGFLSLAFASLFFKEPFIVVLAALYLAGIASFQNTFAGLNGWEIGSGFLISLFLTTKLFLINSSLAPLMLCLNASILGLLIFNRYPAKVFPGDSGTLLIGSAMAAIVVMESSLALLFSTFLFFIPHIIDFSLKMITNPKDPSQKKEPPYELGKDEKLYVPKSMKLDFAKLILLIFGPMKEWKVVLIIWLIVSLNCTFWLLIF